MVVRIHNTAKWAVLQPGQMLELSGQYQRKVRIEFNCPAPTRLDLVEGDKGTFLAVVQGLEVIEFTANGEVYIVPTSEDEVWWFTNDGEQIASSSPEAVSFTKIASRRSRNPELEHMMFKMEQNMLRRQDALFAEMEAMREAETPHDPETGEIEDDEITGDDPAGAGGTDEGASGGDPEPAPAGRAPAPNPEPAWPGDAPEPSGFGAALRGMADRSFLVSQRWQEQQWRANREGAHPKLLEFERLLVRRMSKLGVPMFAAEVLRTPERQDDLYALGNSKAKAGQSPHQYGCAVDLVHSVKGWGLSEKEWLLVGHVGKEVATQRGLALQWGGDWKFYDPAHWEIIDWKNQKENYPWPKLTP